MRAKKALTNVEERTQGRRWRLASRSSAGTRRPPDRGVSMIESTKKSKLLSE